jgi:tRNA-specific 2-thiouridylase
MVAMSGGVDSSVAALLLKKSGYEVVGATMLLGTGQKRACESAATSVSSHVAIVEQVCSLLDIPFHIIDAETEFKRYVINYFCQEYMKGRTPNPCITCNKYIKFGLLLDYAISSGFDYLATGHYARIIERDGTYHLLKGSDEAKDQSYMLYTLSQDKLKRVLFPVGEYSKVVVKELAKSHGLPNWNRPESQDLCFVASNYRDFLRHYLQPQRGIIVDSRGRVIGEHDGVMFYTIGQRHNLGIATGEPAYVIEIDADRNLLRVGGEKELYKSRCLVTNVNWVLGRPLATTMEVCVKIRYKTPEQPAVIHVGDEYVEILFHKAQRAVTPGQAAVFYLNDEVIGGGIISG